jgi:uncharacterized repeat protein (TIGR04138 family)
MPPTDESARYERDLQRVVEDVGRFPIEAFQFIQQGLGYTVEKIHGGLTDPAANRHVSGEDLCEGLREYALLKWGLLARTVLRRWDINSTYDFGQIVFAMIDHGMMSRTPDDTIEDFRDVYDFKTAFEGEYHIALEPKIEKTAEGRK